MSDLFGGAPEALAKATRNRPANLHMVCAGCQTPFLAKNNTARFCGEVCRENHHREQTKARYHEDPAADVRRQLESRRIIANRRWEVLFSHFGNKCADCGNSYPRDAYDLHHISGKKESVKHTPSRTIRMGNQQEFERLLMETILLCAVCHRLRHASSRENPNSMTWTERLQNYADETGYPNSLFMAADGRIVGTWIMGNDYRVQSEYYGGYPATYLRRIKSMFPDKQRALHLFSGKVDLAALPGDTVDINADLSPTYVDDAQRLERVPLADYDLVLADPPYSVEDCERYQTTMVKRNTVLSALSGLSVGAHVVWLDQVLPMYRKDTFSIEAVIGMVKSTNHRFRVVTIFKRIAPITKGVDLFAEITS